MKPHNLYLLILSTRRLSYATGFTLFAIYLLRIIETTPFQLILPGIIYELSIFLFEIPTGVVADVYSRRLSVILGHFFLGLGLIIAGLYPSLLIACIGLAIMGIGSTFVSGALSAWLVDEVGQEQASQAFIRGSQVSTVATLLGIGLSMMLGSWHLQFVVIGAGIPLILLSVLLFVVMPETGFQPLPPTERSSWRGLFTTFGRGIQFVRTSRVLLWIFVIIFLLAGFGETFGKLWQAQLLENFTLPTLPNFDDILWFGLIGSVSTPITLLATELVRKWLDLDNTQTIGRALMLLFIALGAGGLFFATSNLFLAALLGVWLVNILLAMINPLMTIWLNHHIDSHIRATVLSIIGQVNSFGEVLIGGLLAGTIATTFGIGAAIAIAALSLWPLVIVFRLVGKKEATSAVSLLH